jgi:IS30 family transposase
VTSQRRKMIYTQLTYEQRYQIYALLKIGQTQAEISRYLEVHRSTISRELRRNIGDRGYRPKQAHQLAASRSKRSQLRISEDHWGLVKKRIRFDLSPEQVSNNLKENGLSISHEWIYQYVYLDKKNGGDLHTHLRSQKTYRKRTGKYDRRGRIIGQISIDERPSVVDERKRLGDWEGDTIVGARHKGAVLTIVDRKSGYTLLGGLPKREALPLSEQATRLLNSVPHVKTLTLDNGKEFAKHAKIKNGANIEIYFAHPYSSWERGTNENTNGLIWQYLSKSRPLDNITEQELEFIMFRLNHRPRKRLGYLTPHEVFFEDQPVALDT